MTPEQWQAAKDIFAKALELPVEVRAEFVAEECGNDELVQQEVAALLKAHDDTDNLLEQHAFDLTSVQGKSYTGRVFGSYRIVRELGRGGMGAVFLAERDDDVYRQQVAIKVIRQPVADAALEHRFQRERKILALLNHPHIAHLLDGGVSVDGYSYFVMEYVEGEPLLSHVEKHRLNLKERLQLFLKICSAVAYAHRNLVIHRDLKPSNIIIRNDGEPKLLDFGLAKILDESIGDSSQTATAFRAFTPSYASPEQIRGRNITTASDVYSLGILLYELLTNERPFKVDDKSLEEILKEISEQEPTRPSEVLSRHWSLADEPNQPEAQKLVRNPSLLKGDLDNIVLMALRKEPERRYSSVEQLASDIERHLKQLPVVARPNTLQYRASRFLSRNKVAALASAVVLIALIAGLTMALWQASIARAERDRAETRFNDVRKLSNSLLFEIAPKIEHLQGSTEARELLVQRALEYLNRLANESQSDPQLQSELASAFEKIGDLQGNPNKPNLSDFAGAIDSYEKAGEIRRKLPFTPENQKLRARNYHESAAIRFVQNDHQGSLKDSEEAMKIYEQLVAEQPDSFELRTALIEAQVDYAQTFSSNNQYAVAVPLFQKVLHELAELDQSNRETRRLTVRTSAFLGNALSWDGKQAEAEQQMSLAVAGAEKLMANAGNHSAILKTVWRVYMLASSIYEGTDDKTSLKFAREALSVASLAGIYDFADTQAKHNIAKSYSRIGIISITLGRQSEGLENLERAGSVLVSLSEREPKNQSYRHDLGRLYTRYGDAKIKENDLRGALHAFQQSVELFEKISQADEKNLLAQRDLAQSLKSVGKVHLDLKEPSMARQALEQSMAILNRLKAQNALGGFDNKLLADVEGALQKL